MFCLSSAFVCVKILYSAIKNLYVSGVDCSFSYVKIFYVADLYSLSRYKI